MRHLRAASRLLLVSGWTLGSYAIFAVTQLSALFSKHAARRCRAVYLRLWARVSAAIIGMRIRVEGQPPTPPFFLVANHLGYVDIVLLFSQINAVFVAKSEVANWPVIGLLVRGVGTIFVDRVSHQSLPRVLSSMEDALRHDVGVVFFPEGTSSDGEAVMRFKSPLFDAPIRMGFPVECAHIAYDTPAGEPAAGGVVCWWGDMTFGPHIYRLLQLPWFEARIVFGEGVAHCEDRRRFASASRDAVERAVQPAMAKEAV